MFKEKIIPAGKVIYSDLLPDLEHFFTTRESVIRSAEIDVDDNINSICKYLNIERNDFISPVQTHSTNVKYAVSKITDYPDTDGLIIDNYEQAVYLNFADCTPVILYDSRQNIGAVVHAGWRGTVGRIVPKAVGIMAAESGTRAEDLYALIGPAIGMCCYKVGYEVIDGIRSSVRDSSGLVSSDGRVDLKQTNARQLIECGVKESNTDICPYCTSCRRDMFFSYRKENGTTNRHSAVIRLRRK